MVISLEKELSSLPKGSLHVRGKSYKRKKYLYHYLKYREHGKSINKHVPEKEVAGLIQKLQARKNYEKQIKTYMAKMKYLEKISKPR